MAWVLETVRPWVTCFRSAPEMKTRLEHLHWLRRRPGSPRPLSLETGQLMSSVVEACGFYFSDPYGSFEWCWVYSTYPLFFPCLSPGMLVCTKNSGFSHQYVIYSVTFSDSFFFPRWACYWGDFWKVFLCFSVLPTFPSWWPWQLYQWLWFREGFDRERMEASSRCGAASLPSQVRWKCLVLNRVQKTNLLDN